MRKRKSLIDNDLGLAGEALAALEQETGILGVILKQDKKERDPAREDFVLKLSKGEASEKFRAKCKTTVDRQITLSSVKACFQEAKDSGLLITRHLSSEMANTCRRIGLQFIDASGNAFLNAPGFYVFIKGNSKGAANPLTETRGGINPTYLRLLFALFCDPDLIKSPYRMIASRSDIALGAVGNILGKLRRSGAITKDKGSKSAFYSKNCLESWASNYPEILKPKMKIKKFISKDQRWWECVQLERDTECWSGEVAAEKILHIIKPGTQTIYVRPEHLSESLRKFVQKYRLIPDTNGPIEILEAFWDLEYNSIAPEVAPPILVYADLLSSLDPRCIEAAKEIREKCIENGINP